MNEKRHEQLESFWKVFLAEECDEESVFSSIYVMCVDDLLAYGRSLGFDEDTCKDAVHDVFCNFYLKRGGLRGVHHITAFLFRSFKNSLLNAKQKYARIRDLDFSAAPFPVEATVADPLIDEEERRKVVATVEGLLRELTPRQREAIYLRYLQGMSYEEISVMLDMNIDSVRKLMYRAISKLRAQNGGVLNFVNLIFFLSIKAGLDCHFHENLI